MLGELQQCRLSRGLQLTTPETPVKEEVTDDDAGVQGALNTNPPCKWHLNSICTSPLLLYPRIPSICKPYSPRDFSRGLHTGGRYAQWKGALPARKALSTQRDFKFSAT